MPNKFVALVVFLFAAKFCFAGNASGTEVEILKAQLEIMKSYDGKILSVVYWALGGFVTGIFALLAFSWFSNRILIQKDIADLKLQNEVLISNSTKEASDLQFKWVKTELDRRLKTYKQEVVAIQLEMSLSEAVLWKEKEVFTNALRYFFKALDLAIELESSYRISDVLDEISNLLNSWGDKRSPSANDMAKFMLSLSSLGEQYVISVDKIKTKFADF